MNIAHLPFVESEWSWARAPTILKASRAPSVRAMSGVWDAMNGRSSPGQQSCPPCAPFGSNKHASVMSKRGSVAVLERAAQGTAEPHAVITAERQPRAVLKHGIHVALFRQLKFLHSVQVHDGAAVHPQEPLRIQHRLHPLHRVPNLVPSSPAVQAYMTARRLDPVNVFGFQEEQPSSVFDREPPHVFRRRPA